MATPKSDPPFGGARWSCHGCCALFLYAVGDVILRQPETIILIFPDTTPWRPAIVSLVALIMAIILYRHGKVTPSEPALETHSSPSK